MALKTQVLVLASVLTAGASTAFAQEMPPPVPLPATLPGGAQAERPPQASAPSQPTPIDDRRRREQIIMMEAMLTQAVRLGAEDTARQIREVQPGLPLFTGFAKTRGFFIEGHGVFFHVEIPGVQPSVAWLVERLERDRLGEAGASRANMAGGRMFDPNAAYTVAVQQRLIDSMLKTSMDVGPDEWITIAAHDVDVRGTAAIEESITLMLRVRGSDLLDLRAGRLSLDEARERIRVREF